MLRSSSNWKWNGEKAVRKHNRGIKMKLNITPSDTTIFLFYYFYYWLLCGPGSSVGIATDYWLDGPGSNPGGDEIFRPSRPALVAHPVSRKMGTGSFPGVKCGRGVLLTTHPLLVPRSWKSRVYLYPPSRPRRPVTGSLYLLPFWNITCTNHARYLGKSNENVSSFNLNFKSKMKPKIDTILLLLKLISFIDEQRCR